MPTEAVQWITSCGHGLFLKHVCSGTFLTHKQAFLKNFLKRNGSACKRMTAAAYAQKALFFIEAVRILFFIEHAFNYCKVHRHLRWLCHCRYRPHHRRGRQRRCLRHVRHLPIWHGDDRAVSHHGPGTGYDGSGLWHLGRYGGERHQDCQQVPDGLRTGCHRIEYLLRQHEEGWHPPHDSRFHHFCAGCNCGAASGDGHGNRVRKLQDNWAKPQFKTKLWLLSLDWGMALRICSNYAADGWCNSEFPSWEIQPQSPQRIPSGYPCRQWKCPPRLVF